MTHDSVAWEEAERLLFRGRWHPVTTSMTFFAGEVGEVVRAFEDWRGVWEVRRFGAPFRVEPVSGDLDGLLARLVPLQMLSTRRYLFVPVATDGPYRTAVFGDNWNGTETHELAVGLVDRGIATVSFRSCPDDPSGEIWPGGFHGVHDFVAMSPAPGPRDSDRVAARVRTVGISTGDTGRWGFGQSGEPLPFEDTSAYTARRPRDRFGQQALIAYAAVLGLRPFDEDSYAPDREATLVSYTSPAAHGSRLVALADAQGRPADAVGVPDPEAATTAPPQRPTTVTWVRPDGTAVDQS